MKQKFIQHLTDHMVHVLKHQTTVAFGDIGLQVELSLLEGGYRTAFKSQGVAKDRQIKSFLEGMKVGYIAAITEINDI